MLAILIKRAKNEGQISGVIPNLVDDGLSILQYVDDTILFMKHNFKHVKNVKLFLSAFKQLSGLKINFYKMKYFALKKSNITNHSNNNYLDVKKHPTHLDT
jgi:hypothetical protein